MCLPHGDGIGWIGDIINEKPRSVTTHIGIITAHCHGLGLKVRVIRVAPDQNRTGLGENSAVGAEAKREQGTARGDGSKTTHKLKIHFAAHKSPVFRYAFGCPKCCAAPSYCQGTL